MGKMFKLLTWEELCDLMCGVPEEDEEGGEDDGTVRGEEAEASN